MNTKSTLTQISPEDFADLIDARIEKRLENLEKKLYRKDANDELLTRDEACKFLQIDPSTLWAWQNRGKVKSYGISGNRRYYKRSELIEALTPLKK